MGYYPTPQTVIEAIASTFTPALPDAPGRLLDPCAGKGEAAAALGQALNCRTWGAELSPVRAEAAAAVMDRVFPVAWESTFLTDESISILLLNPPYDWERAAGEGEKSQRLEYKFLRSTTPKLVRGLGVLVYLVPQWLLGREEVARYLAAHYEERRIARFPDGEFERFRQVVVFARRRLAHQVPTKDDVAAVQQLAEMDLPQLTLRNEPVYPVIPAPTRGAAGRAVRFYRNDWSPEEMVAATRQVGVHTTQAWRDLVTGGNGMLEMQPVMPLKKGHVAMLMSSGMMGTLRLTDADGHPMLVKGRVVKVPHKAEEVVDEEKGEKVIKWRDRFITTVAALSARGLQVIDDVPGLTAFMQAHGDKIAGHILKTYRPLYALEPTPEEQAVVDRLGTERKPLPGQIEAGLLPTQKHAAIAMARSIRCHGVGNVQGEMGCGKSTIGATVVELLDAYPAIVICPPHLVPKWIREVQEVIPGAHARELQRIGRNADDVGDVNDVRAFLDDHAAGRISHKAVAVVASTSAKMGPGWQVAAPVRRAIPEDPGKRGQFKSALEAAKAARKVYQEARGVVDAKRLVELRQAAVRARREALRLATPRPSVAAHLCPSCGVVQVVEKDDMRIPFSTDQLGKKRMFCEAPVPGWELDRDGRLKRDEDGKPVWSFRPCGSPLFEYSGVRRYGIAQYVKEQAHGRFKLLLGDECHQYKAKASDRGVAFHQLVTATKGTLTLTGTFFGGPSTSIFWLLHRLSGGVRGDFGFHDEKRWASLYGVLETVERRSYDQDDEDGVHTGNRRYRNQAKEVPGVSPAIISRLLDTTVFLNLKDLGVALPAYAEEVVVLDMAEEQETQYRGMDSSLKAMAVQSMCYMSAWLQWSLSRPNSAFRDEVVKLPFFVGHDDDGKEVFEKQPYLQLPAVVTDDGERQWLPKERWLADYCRSEKAQGRKVLVYVRQTGTRDIQDRVQAALQVAGLRVAVLGGNVDPRKREKWIEQRASKVDVLITNPKLTETGLDLIQFATIVFFEIEYSLYVLWQSCRRVWRLGQTKPVKVVYAVYAGSMEVKALALMGRKMKAAQLLFGDEVGGAIVPEDSGDFLTELAREVLAGAALPDLQTLFADDSPTSDAAIGSLVKVSPPILTMFELARQLGVRPTRGNGSGRRRKTVEVSDNQLTLFTEP